MKTIKFNNKVKSNDTTAEVCDRFRTEVLHQAQDKVPSVVEVFIVTLSFEVFIFE